MNKLQSFLAQVFEKTGIRVLLDSEQTESACTTFNITLDKSKYTVKIQGQTEVEKNYALFIKALAQSFKASNDLTKQEFLSAVLKGELDDDLILAHAKRYSLKTGSVCAMIISSPLGRLDEIKEVVNNYGFGDSDWIVDLNENAFVYVKFASDHSTEHFSMGEYAEFIYQSIVEETGIATLVFVGGTVNSLTGLSRSYSQAESAMRICTSLGLGVGVHSFKQFLIAKILEDLPKERLNEYVALVSDEGIKELMSDSEITMTAQEFLESNLNASQTARKLFLHRNTLSYRLDKIQRETGLNIRNFSDAVTFRLITLLMNMEK